MRIHLSTAISPYDASMEMILPGIQERLNGLNSQIDSKFEEIKTSLRGIETSIPDKVDEVIKTVQIEMAEIQATAFHAVANAITQHRRSEQPHGNAQEAVTTNIPTMRDIHTTQNQNRTTREITRNSTAETTALHSARLSPHFASLSQMWDEWHGTGRDSTLDKPIPGGFARLEELHKSKWRKHFNAAEGRHFTRCRLVIDGIKNMASASQMPVEAARDILEIQWTRFKKSPGALVLYLQEQDYLKKTKPRGRHVS